LKFKDIDGSTPIADCSGLLPDHITTQAQLNEWEKNNIITAQKKYLGRRRKHAFDSDFFRAVHRDMFDDTWEWAGIFRKCNFNLGVDFCQIQIEMKKLSDDVKHWQEKLIFGVLEQSVRLHHRLVQIHAFQNGNGRHGRLVQDIFLFNNNHPLPEWPSGEIIEKTDIRNRYIKALHSADAGDYRPLLNLVTKLTD
jgi:Fic-DOC domain mobile mystery protein B